MGEDSIKKTTDSISNRKIENGNEAQEYQKAENQVLNINSERRNNLNNAAVENKMNAENNANLEQAAGLMAGMNAQAPSVEAQAQSMNPQTQSILGKYGIGKPGTTRKTNSNTTQTPQKVTINNNTSTVNNIQVTQPNIPISAPKIPMRPREDNSGTIKSWLSNIFARQKEQAAIREKEYNKKEWSLSRSANKMMRRMEEVGKSFMERLDPRRISANFFDQAKTLLFLLGFQYLSKNWGNILKTAATVEEKISEFVNFLKGDNKTGKENFFTKLSKNIVRYLGGDPGHESIGEALRGLFHEGIDYLKMKWDNAMELRAQAIKSIKFPDKLNITDLPGMFKTLMEYIGNVFTAFVNPVKGAINGLNSTITRKAIEGNMEENEHDKKFRSVGGQVTTNSKGLKLIDENGDNIGRTTSWGDASILEGGHSLNVTDIGSNGLLANNTVSTIRQGRTIGANINSNSGNVKSSSVMLGLSQLETSVKNSEDGGALVDDYTLNSLEKLGVDRKSLSEDIEEKKYKFVKVEKTDDDYLMEGIESDGSSFAKGYINQYLSNLVGFDKIQIASAATAGAISGSILPGPGTVTSGIAAGAAAYLRTRPEVAGLIDNLINKAKKATATKYTMKMVPLDDERPALSVPMITEDGRTVNKKEFVYYKISPRTIDKIKSQIGEKVNKKDFEFNFNEGNILSLDKLLKDVRKDTINKEIEEKKKLPWGFNSTGSLEEKRDKMTSDINPADFHEVNQLREKEEQHKFEEDVFWLNSRAKRGINEAEGDITATINYIQDRLNARYPEEIPISNAEMIRRSNLAMSKLIKTFGLTPEQASGLVGNWIAESNLDNTEYNKENGGNGALGIAQWRNVRQDNFVKFYNKRHPGNKISKNDITKTSFEDQLDFAIHELSEKDKNDPTKGTHSKAIAKIKETSTPSDAARMGLGYYEFSVGPEGAIRDLASHGSTMEKALDSLDKRKGYANTALANYYNSDPKAFKDNTDIVNSNKEDISEVSMSEEKVKAESTIPTNSPNANTNSEHLPISASVQEDITKSNNSTSEKVSIDNITPWGKYATSNKVKPESIKLVARNTPQADNSNSPVQKPEGSSNVLSVIQNISESLEGQNIYLRKLGTSVESLAYVAANSGNITVTNNSTGNKVAQGSYTNAPNSSGGNYQENMT